MNDLARSAVGADEASGVFFSKTCDEGGSLKSEAPFLSIGAAAAKLGLPAHVLRYWETQFDGLQPIKRSGGRRYYRPSDMEFLVRLRSLLHDQAYTIRGAQRLLAITTNPSADATVGLSEQQNLRVGEASEMSPLELQAVVYQAALAGVFGAAAGGAQQCSRETFATVLTLLEDAKARLDAVRIRA